MRAFVSHAGQNSLTEAASSGIPIVAIPLFSDQLYNAVLAKHKGMAVFVDIRKLNGNEAEEIMSNALNEVGIYFWSF
jgi:UDP:flavonoid glycosyltransferase YjiC (YdhE family)